MQVFIKRRDNYEVIQKVLDILPTSKVNIIDPRQKDGRGKYLVASPHKLFAQTKWQGKVKLEDGIGATIEWYQANSDWLSQFSNHISADRKTHDFLTDSNLHLPYWEE